MLEFEKIIGDYKKFYFSIKNELSRIGIDITGREISHLGYKTASNKSYQTLRQVLIPLSSEYLENEHNGRPILKANLAKPLLLDTNVEVTMIELMPPKPDIQYEDGLEHLGIVLGTELPNFEEKFKSSITEIQNQGPYCKPACIALKNNKRAKFYEYNLKQAIILEGQTFYKSSAVKS